ncbi:MAG: hypothetical protein II311_00965 [Lachnospiraceae bacterium]|nr:hypothetical protein [Lachnospiraceae bacterium]
MNRQREIREFFCNFLKCGVAGWCMEIIFTSMESIAAKDMRLMGRISLLMFPIYGMGAMLRPISGWMDRWIGEPHALTPKDIFWRHGFSDMVLIFCAEYVTGAFLKARNMCPWDYSGRIWNVDGLIRLDFAPFWFAAGLIFERLTRTKN